MSNEIKSAEIASKVTVYMKYAKFIEDKQRREDWEEICIRNRDMHIKKYSHIRSEIEAVYRDFVITKKVLPSMRSMQFAGKPIEVNNTRIYNCSFLPVDNYHAFSETMFLLLSGTGVGYSVQKQHIKQLKPIAHPKNERKYLIGDSIEGWADAVKELVKAYFGYRKSKPRFDFSDIRAKGERLITSGGKAPGPEPLKYALGKIEEIFLLVNPGDKLTSLNAHDILCHIADAVLAGGIRRSACISMFSKDDEDMLTCKANKPTTLISAKNCTYLVEREVRTDVSNWDTIVEQNGVQYKLVMNEWDMSELKKTGHLGWWVCNSQRGRANNSVCLDRDISKAAFLKIWKQVEESKAGEPGFYFTNDFEMGTNPSMAA